MGEFIVRDEGGLRRVPVYRLLTVGRSQNNDLVLNSIYASRRHAWVWRQGDQYIIEDLDSTHGTFVNGQRLAAPQFLKDHDIVIMGEARLTFVSERQPSTEQTPPHGVPRPNFHQIQCAQCGAPNQAGAGFCDRCGARLVPGAGAVGPAVGPGGEQRGKIEGENSVRTERPLTPVQPVVARPFPSAPTQPRERSAAKGGGGVWILIVLLAVLAASLLLIIGLLLAYILV